MTINNDINSYIRVRAGFNGWNKAKEIKILRHSYISKEDSYGAYPGHSFRIAFGRNNINRVLESDILKYFVCKSNKTNYCKFYNIVTKKSMPRFNFKVIEKQIYQSLYGIYGNTGSKSLARCFSEQKLNDFATIEHWKALNYKLNKNDKVYIANSTILSKEKFEENNNNDVVKTPKEADVIILDTNLLNKIYNFQTSKLYKYSFSNVTNLSKAETEKVKLWKLKHFYSKSKIGGYNTYETEHSIKFNSIEVNYVAMLEKYHNKKFILDETFVNVTNKNLVTIDKQIYSQLREMLLSKSKKDYELASDIILTSNFENSKWWLRLLIYEFYKNPFNYRRENYKTVNKWKNLASYLNIKAINDNWLENLKDIDEEGKPIIKDYLEAKIKEQYKFAKDVKIEV